jgi:Flp pilus assembly pilin Flp
MSKIMKCMKSNRGVSSIEYAVLAVGIMAAVVGALVVFTPQLEAAFGNIGTQLQNATAPRTAG